MWRSSDAALRLSTSVFTELRELIFAKASFGASKQIALEVFGHLHALSLRFHLERQTGGLSRDIERGTRALQSLLSYSLYTIAPTIVEVALVLGFLGWRFDWGYVGITAIALVVYVTFSVWITEWRTQFRRTMNELDSKAHTRAIDALLNYETVKYFNNEAFEAQRYEQGLESFRQAQVKSQMTLSMLNTGQQLIIATSLVRPPSSAFAIRSGSITRPQGSRTATTSAPQRSASSIRSSPKRPHSPTTTRSPGSTSEVIAASSPARPVPETGYVNSFAVWKPKRESAITSPMIAVNSGSNWPRSGVAIARSTRGSAMVGPGPSRIRGLGRRSPVIGCQS